MDRKFRAEVPRLMQPGERLYSLAEQIADWVVGDDRKHGSWVAGVWGGRGTGKTSLLSTVLHILDQRFGGRDVPLVSLPKRNEEAAITETAYDRERLFRPSYSRDGEDLLFLLLQHLEERYRHPRSTDAKSAFTAIRTAEVKRNDPRPFLDYEKEVAVSPEKITERFVETHKQLAATTVHVRQEFAKLLKTFSSSERRPLLLCVDDLDLRPDRALDLLEIIELFLSHDGVIVLLAADRELMLLSIKEALGDRGLRQPGLAGTMLAKLVPYGWALPMPSPAERFELLWSPVGSSDPTLPAWWVRDPVHAANARNEAERALIDVLPRTYRGLVAAHNRLLSLQDEIDPSGNTFDALSDAVRGQLGSFYLSADAAPLLSGVAIADVQMQELGLLDVFRFSPEQFVDELQLYGHRAHEKEETTRSKRNGIRKDGSEGKVDEEQRSRGLFAALLAAVAASGSSALEGRRLLAGLLRLYEALAETGRRADRFFAISMDDDALRVAERHWHGRFTEDAVQSWHLKLMDLAEGSMVHPEKLREARRRAFEFLESRGIRGFQGSVEVFARAKLSFLVWLGWEMRFVTQVLGLNFYSGKFRPFSQPDPIRFRDLHAFQLLRPDPPLQTSAEPQDAKGNAVLIVDTGGRSTVDQLGVFFEQEGGAAVETPDAYLLSAPPGAELEPDELRDVLQDAIEMIGRLRQDRGVRRLHLGIAAPDVVAFFLGQQINATGMEIRLYEFYENQYRFVFRLEQNEP